ncbi:AraC family transcriptional regulator [Dyella acidiphila]|uniref:AraC family transcriptional regulator n=1 Tax=Dyella acidiphila TaxID=2775866 RepID=A0ABR9G4R7_9GAMM|nr:AraC family transcriptional regulator [Dyella acidiphila]MBE1159038.1 AraC family transcriptional regulator [Dyella acidiphila]
MDSLSHLVRMLSPSGRVDLHCHLAGTWAADQPAAPPGHVPYHVILGGRMRVRIGRRVEEFEAGDVLIFPQGSHHVLESVDLPADAAPPDGGGERHFNGVVTEIRSEGEGVLLDMLCGVFVMRETGSSLLRSLPEVIHIRSGERAALRALIGMMRSESVEPKPGGSAVIDELSTALFTLLLRHLISTGQLSGNVLALLADARMSRVVEAVLAQPAQSWTVGSLAAHAHVSRATFARRFTELGGMPPLEWVTTVRMELAARLLLREGLSANQVAERCGYASEAAFGRVFKKHYRSGPGAYRRKLQHAQEPSAPA